MKQLENQLREASNGGQPSQRPSQSLFNFMKDLATWVQSKLWQNRRTPQADDTLLLRHVPSQTSSGMHYGQNLLHVLFCINKENTGPKLYQERIRNFNTDRGLFHFLSKQYNRYRGISTWLTLRSIQRLSLSRIGSAKAPLTRSNNIERETNATSVRHRLE